ncbi:MAG: hypothetical protein E7476_07575 [Ruminococcaceae bacterium]|nr:hypothetical protein [Oscillospiraceae bacterium]
MNFNDFDCSMSVIDWPELNKLNDKATECYKYLGNHFGDDGSVYAVFGNATAEKTLAAILIDK